MLHHEFADARSKMSRFIRRRPITPERFHEKNMHETGPVLVIGSGLGGLGVVRELREVLPREDILYFAFPWHFEQTAETLALTNASDNPKTPAPK